MIGDKFTPIGMNSPKKLKDFFTLDAGGEFAYLTSSDGAFGASDNVRVKLLEKKVETSEHLSELLE